MTPHPADLTVQEAGRALRSGTLTARALTQAHLDRIAARDAAIGAFTHVATDAALAAADTADAALARGTDLGPLHGIPFAIKDIFDVAGWPVRWGSSLSGERIAPATAPAVQAMLNAGAVPLGLVATYELATVGPDARSLYPQPRNPWCPTHITGGSSSGSAAAVAAGMVRIALGTDTGGSVRSPAAYCGVVGLKPGFGAVAMDGVMPLAPSLDHIGPIARTVAEAAAVFDALCPGAAQAPAPARVAYIRGWCADPAAHPGLQGLMDDAASVLSLCGLAITLADLPDYGPLEAAAADIILAEEYASFGAALADNPDATGPMARQSILSGAKVTAKDLNKSRGITDGFRAGVDALLATADVLILPTVMAPAPPFSAFAHGAAVWTAMRTLPFNVTGHPAISVPMGFADGLPMGLQIVGRHGAEGTVLQAAALFEAATDHAAAYP